MSKLKNLTTMKYDLHLPIPKFVGLGEIGFPKQDQVMFDDDSDMVQNWLYVAEHVTKHFYRRNYDGLISVRSSPEVSMPGLCRTILNVPLLNRQSLALAYNNVYDSFYTKQAEMYRKRFDAPTPKIPEVVFQEMVDGTGRDSCSGIFYTRNPQNPSSSYIVWDTKEAGAVNGSKGKGKDVFCDKWGDQYLELLKIGIKLEQHFRYPQDIEFVIDNGKLWILQTRDVVFDKQTIYKAHYMLVQEGQMTEEEYKKRTPEYNKEDWAYVFNGIRIVEHEFEVLSTGLGLGNLSRDGRGYENFILISEKLLVDEHINLDRCRGIITTIGNRLCHAAILARKYKIPCFIVPHHDVVKLKTRVKNDEIVMDGKTGAIFYNNDSIDIDYENIEFTNIGV